MDRPRARRWLELGLVVGTASVLSWWYFARTFLQSRTAAVDFMNFDMYTYVYPVLQYWFEGVRGGDFALWNPYQACGAPFAATENGLFYPLNFLHLLLPTGRAIGYTAVLHFVLAGVFQYLFLRAHRLTWPACTAGALTFMLMPLLAVYAWFPGLQNATVWIAGLLWACERVVRTPTPGAAMWLALAIALQLLAGRSQTVIYTWYVVGPYAVGRLLGEWRRRNPVWRRALVAVAAALLCGSALAAVQMVPEAELASHGMHSTSGVSRAAAEAYPGTPKLSQQWQTLVTFGGEPADPDQAVPPFGWHLLAAALLSVVLVRRPLVWLFAAIAVVSFVLSAGSNTWLYDLYRVFPTGTWFRVPARFLFLTVYALSVLAAFGIDAAWRRPNGPRWAAAIPLAAVALVCWQTAALTPTWIALNAAFAVGWVLLVTSWHLARRVGAAMVAAALGLALIAVGPHPHAHPFDRDQGYVAADAGLRQRLASELQPGMRVFYPNVPYDYVPLAKVGWFDGLRTVTDYEPLSLRPFAQFIESLHGPGARFSEAFVFFGQFSLAATPRDLRLLDLTSVQLIVQKGERTQFDDFARTALQPITVTGERRLYRNPSALPRAFVVPAFEIEPDASRALQRLGDPGFDPRATVVLDRAPPAQVMPGATGSATLVQDDPDSVVVTASASAPALLVLTDTYYPGWRAAVDGESTVVLRANFLFRAVSISAGTHEVAFAFRPNSFRLGAAISAVALLALLAVAMWSLRGRRGLTAAQ